jgi:UDP-N-acetylmuramate--alanine ligase
VVIANGQDANIAKLIRQLSEEQRFETFGLDPGCNFHAEEICLKDGFYTFNVYHNAELLGSTRITLPGRHNIMNALAVIAMASNIGIAPQQTLSLLDSFTGMDRRLMLKGQFGQISVLDDYAHHPTEIRASLAAIRQRYNPNRLWCVFQPHQYSRTRFLLKDFTESFALADVTIVPEIYFVRDSDSARKQTNAQTLVEQLQAKGTQSLFIKDFGAICKYLKDFVKAGDVVVTMGAGDIWKVADEYIQWLRGNSPD